MSRQPKKPIVIAVGLQGAESAVFFAVGEGRRTRRSVHVVHMLERTTRNLHTELNGYARELSSACLEAAITQAEYLSHGEVAVSSEVIDSDSVVSDLVEHAKNAHLIVLQHRGLTGLYRLLTRSVTTSVAVNSVPPVVSVHEAWNPISTPHRRVTAAVHDLAAARSQLGLAFPTAQDREADLLVIQASWRGDSQGNTSADEAGLDGKGVATKNDLEQVLKGLQSRFPDVSVIVSPQSPPLTDAIVKASEISDLVVIPRRHHPLPPWTHLGPVGQAVLNRSRCPVLITPA